MTNRSLFMILNDLKYWFKAHWFLSMTGIGFILIWRAAGIGVRDTLTGNIYPSLLLLIPLLITFLLSFLLVINEDMAT